MMLPSALAVVPAGPLRGRLAAPASKSVTNRLLVIATLAGGESLLERPLHSDDSAAMRRVVAGLGAEVVDEAAAWRVRGTGGRLRTPARLLDAGLSGTTMRFGAALATLAPGGATLTGLPPLLHRPVGPLTAALRALGADAKDQDGRPPVVLGGGGLDGGEVRVDSSWSSQFPSAVLLVAPYARRDVTVTVEGSPSLAYITLTVEVMGAWGAQAEQVGAQAWRVRAGDSYRPRRVTVEYDASAAAHLFALAAATGGEVTVTNAPAGSAQPDAAIPALLKAMGATVRRDGDALTVTGPEILAPLEADLRAMPDQVTTMAALAALAPGTSRLSGVEVARTHETDRLAALTAELAKVGVAVDGRPDGLVIHGGTACGPARLATYDDHRLAMSFAALAARVPGVVVEDPGCVAKTYPGFWDDLRRTGADWRPAP